MAALPPSHDWRFFRAGGFDQVRLDRGTDLLHLDVLDQKLWVALSCPVSGLEFDARTLALLDRDGDGQIRAPELIAALQWAGSLVTDPDLLARGADPLPLAAIATDTEAGAQLLASARRILHSLGKDQADNISVADTGDSSAIFAQARLNGDGILPPEACGDPALAALVQAILQTLGGETDRSGALGVSRPQVERFFAEAKAWLAWQGEPAADPARRPLGEATDQAYAAYAAVREKVEDYFTRCRLAAFDRRAGDALNGSDEELAALAPLALNPQDPAVARLPLARIGANQPLPLGNGLNPAWTEAMGDFHQRVVTPLLGERESLSRAEWDSLVTTLAPYGEWQEHRVETPVADLPAEDLGRWVADGSESHLLALIDEDAALAPEFAAMGEVDRLVRYVRDLGRLANNFVNFRDFYTCRNGAGEPVQAIFQAGTLYLDGRSADLCLKVTDPTRHGALASLSKIYLAYCDCRRGEEKMTIAAAITAGDADQLMVGRNGVFYDRQGRDWDATVVRIVDHPISIRQAFWSPYRKMGQLVAEQLQKFAAAKANSVEQQAGAAINSGAKQVESSATAPKPPEAKPTPFDVGKFAGIFAAIGLAVGALGTALASVITGFLNLHWWQMPVALIGLILIISGPAMLLAWFKLRKRNLGPLLDASGWAVNARALINIPFGTTLTQLAHLPEGADRGLTDPYAEKPLIWPWVVGGLAATLVLAWYLAHKMLA